MLRLESTVSVDGLTGREVSDFLLSCDDARYQAWWPGTHLRLHRIATGPGPGPVGDVWLMDELIGSHRLRMAAEVVELVPGERLVWRMRWWRLPLPAWLTLELEPEADGVRVRHTVTAGWAGPGRVLDPLLRLYLSRSFAADLDRHVQTEFPLLRDQLRRESGVP